jgi:hypothetical protein
VAIAQYLAVKTLLCSEFPSDPTQILALLSEMSDFAPRTMAREYYYHALEQTMGNYRHTIISGEDYSTTLSFKTPDGQPEDLTGSTFTSEILNFLGTAIASFTCELADQTGDLIVSLPKADSIRLVPSVRYTHTLKRVYPDGSVKFPVRGDIVVYFGEPQTDA